MFALRNWAGVAVVAAVCGFGSEARAQSGTVLGVNDGTGVAGVAVGKFTTYSTGTLRITTYNYVIDIYVSAATASPTALVTTFVMRDTKTLDPVYGGECLVPLGLSTTDIRLHITKEYFGNAVQGFETRAVNSSTWSRYRLTVP